jgi:hypothetical protein
MSKTATTIDYADREYVINRVGGFDFLTAVSIWRLQHMTFDKFERVTRGNYEGTHFNDFFNAIREVWDTAPEITIQKAFTTPNLEHRRIIFNALGVEKLMAELEPELVDKQTIERINIEYDNDGSEHSKVLTDTYELYKIDSEKLFSGPETINRWRSTMDRNVYAVKCKDASTDREYWIYVHPDAVREEKDAITAIAWTYQMTKQVYTKEIYRQGEVIIAKHAEGEDPTARSRWGRFYHLDKEEYMNKIKAQS